MSQVNMLAIDLAKSVDSQAVSAKGSNNNDDRTSAFSDVMAKHQEQESGNNSQQSGNINNEKVNNDNAEHNKATVKAKNSESDADKKSLENEHSSVENESNENMANDQAASDQTASDNDNVGSKSAILLAQKNANVQNTNPDEVAKKLLSFIVASDEVSAEHVDAKSQADSLDNSEGESSIEGTKVTKVSENSSKANQPISEAENSAEKVSYKATVNAESTSVDEVNSKAGQQSSEASSNERSATNLTLSTTAKSVKEAIYANNVLENETVETKGEASLKNSVSDALASSSVSAGNNVNGLIHENINNEASSEKTDKKNSLLEKLTQESKQSIKLSAEKSNVIKPSNQTSNVVDPHVADLIAEDVKHSNKNEQSIERFTNQTASNSRTSSDNNQFANQQSSQQEQQSSKQNYTGSENDSEQIKEIPQVFSKNEQENIFSDKMIVNASEKSAVQSIVSEAANHQALSQQSLNYAEEQAIQSNIAKAAADSISVQSAKTAFNVQAETISITRKDFADAVKDKVMVMINQKIKQLDIRLDPPELGSMHVKLNLQNEQAAVNFVVQNQQAKEALEQNIDKLKDMLAQSGVEVGDANIEQRNQQTGEGSDASQQQGGHNGLTANNTEDDEMTMLGANLYKASASGVDYYA